MSANPKWRKPHEAWSVLSLKQKQLRDVCFVYAKVVLISYCSECVEYEIFRECWNHLAQAEYTPLPQNSAGRLGCTRFRMSTAYMRVATCVGSSSRAFVLACQTCPEMASKVLTLLNIPSSIACFFKAVSSCKVKGMVWQNDTRTHKHSEVKTENLENFITRVNVADVPCTPEVQVSKIYCTSHINLGVCEPRATSTPSIGSSLWIHFWSTHDSSLMVHWSQVGSIWLCGHNCVPH